MTYEPSRIQNLIAAAKEMKVRQEVLATVLPRDAYESIIRNLDCIIHQLEAPKPLCCPRCGRSVQLDTNKSDTKRLIYSCPCLEEHEQLWWQGLIGPGCKLLIMESQDQQSGRSPQGP